MQNLKILNSKEIKHILELLREHYGTALDKEHYAFLMNKENKIYIVTREIGQLPLEDMRIDSLGTYFGELYKESIRLSIEGAQIIGQTATKSIVELNREEMLAWLIGSDIACEESRVPHTGFIILTYTEPKTNRTDILGCGRFKDGKIQNLVSKSRKLVVVNQ